MTARSVYDRELEKLRKDLVEMGRMAEEAITRSIQAFRERDFVLANQIQQSDDELDQMEKQLEARCLAIILRQQPVAGDLRKVSATLKMTTDLERIGDHAADIAELTMQIRGDYLEGLMRYIPEMAEIAVQMVHDAIGSFVEGDLALAKAVRKRDDVVDMLFCDVKKELAQILKEEQDQQNNSIDFLMIAKYLERIADHAVNICEWTEFLETGMHKRIPIL